MKPDDAAHLLDRAAARARTRPDFLGWVLARYQDLESLREANVQEQLGVSAEDWPRLQLCLRPRADRFLPDLTQIAQAFSIDRGALAAIIRRVDAVEAVRVREEPGQAGSLLAARTRKPRPPKPEGGSDD
ncbi:MAG: hypothetical protein L0Z62_11760 [Gemmataceae bacterium]|nr:hypothetical protein [Gemmataceae bacterium]